MTGRTIPWTYGKVLVRISAGKIIKRGSKPLTPDDDLRGAIEAFGEPAGDAQNRAMYSEKVRRTLQHHRDSGKGLPMWVCIGSTKADIQKEPHEEPPAPPPDSSVASPVRVSHPTAVAMAALLGFESLTYPT